MTQDAMIAGLYLLVTQILKKMNPEVAEKNKHLIATFIVGFSAFFGLMAYLATHNTPYAPNIPALIVLIVTQIAEGAILGASAVGLYEVGHNVGMLRSTTELLVAKTNVTKVVETTEMQPIVEVTEEAVTDTQYTPETETLKSDESNVATFTGGEVKVKKSTKKGK